MTIRKVMLVDDEADLRTIGEMSLSAVGGWEVVVAASGAEALQLFERERPDAVLLDVMMPELDGPGTLAKLRELPNFGDTPVVFLTAKVQKHEVAHYISLGAAGVIPKPFDPMTLADTVREIVAGTSG